MKENRIDNIIIIGATEKEDDVQDEQPAAIHWKRQLYDLFKIHNLIEGFKAVFKKRQYHKRLFIVLLIIAFEMEMFALHGKWNCMYLYFRRVLEWNIGTFSRYTSVLGSFGLIAQYVLVPILSSKLKLHDSTIALLGMFIEYVVYQHLHIFLKI